MQKAKKSDKGQPKGTRPYQNKYRFPNRVSFHSAMGSPNSTIILKKVLPLLNESY